MKIQQSFISAVVIALLAVTTAVVAFSVQQESSNNNGQSLLSSSRASISRAQWLQQAGTVLIGTAVAVGAGPQVAFAKDVDPSLKGTKKDPAFEACLSQCVYECTKPKGAEQKSRAECLPECKKQCATTKAQLMTGTPLQKTE